MHIKSLLRTWRDFWHRPLEILPHFGTTAEGLAQHFDRMAAEGHRNFGHPDKFDPRRRMGDLAVRLLALHLDGATP